MTDTVPPPSEEWKTEEPWEDDSLAMFEETGDPLDAQLKEQDKRNRLQFKKVTGILIILSTLFAWALLVSGLGVWSWHYLTPYAFLDEHQLTKVQSIIFSGTLGALISTLSRSYVRRDE